MAKALGFRPDGLVRARPDPKHKWKLPVKYWIHELHFKRFGRVLGEKPLPPPEPEPEEPLEEALKRMEEEIFWEDYRARNAEDAPKKRPARKAAPPAPSAAPPAIPSDQWILDAVADEDVPF